MLYALGQQVALEKLALSLPRAAPALESFASKWHTLPPAKQDAIRIALGLGVGGGVTALASSPEHRLRGAMLGAGADLGLMAMERSPDMLSRLAKVIR